MVVRGMEQLTEMPMVQPIQELTVMGIITTKLAINLGVINFF